jgi:hypothetical protein
MSTNGPQTKTIKKLFVHFFEKVVFFPNKQDVVSTIHFLKKHNHCICIGAYRFWVGLYLDNTSQQ